MGIGNNRTETPISAISLIKLRRSFGHTVIIGSLVTAVTVGIIGAATAQSDAWIFGYTAAEGFGLGVIAGAVWGGGISSIIAGTG